MFNYLLHYSRKPKTLRVLHVWDECAVAALICRELNGLGFQCRVIKRWGFDAKINQDRFYHSELIVKLVSPPRRKEDASNKRRLYLLLPNPFRKFAFRLFNYNRTLRFYVEVMKRAWSYDVVHIHDCFLAGLLLPFKPKVYLFHGDSIRHSPSLKSLHKRLFIRLAVRLLGLFQKLYVSTPDLVNEGSNLVWIPNPVDTKLFVSLEPNVNPKGRALHFLNWFDDKDWAKRVAGEHGWKLTVLDRSRQECVSYEGMPRFFSYFEVFIDRTNIKSLSKSALEALAMGLSVVRWDGKIIKGLPSKHDSLNVALCWLKIYRNKLK